MISWHTNNCTAATLTTTKRISVNSTIVIQKRIVIDNYRRLRRTYIQDWRTDCTVNILYNNYTAPLKTKTRTPDITDDANSSKSAVHWRKCKCHCLDHHSHQKISCKNKNETVYTVCQKHQPSNSNFGPRDIKMSPYGNSCVTSIASIFFRTRKV